MLMRAICIDDELLALDLLEKQLHELNGINVIGKYLNPLEGLEAIRETKPHIVFLDISLPEMSGIEVAKEIIKIDKEINIAFVTAYDNFAVEAFSLNVLDYLVKPITKDRLRLTIERLQKTLHYEEKQVTSEPSKLYINMHEYLTFQTADGEIVPITWRTAKSQELFVYLLHHHDRYIEKDVLIELLWGDKDLESGTSLLYTNVYNIRKSLESYRAYFQLKNRLNGYVLKLSHVVSKGMNWSEKLNRLPILNEDSITTYVNVLKEYDDSYLCAHDYFWLESERQEVYRRWLRVLEDVIVYYKKEKQFTEAIHFLEEMCQLLPTEEFLYFSMMQLYNDLEDLDAIATVYRKLIQVLKQDLDIDPSVEVKEWYRQNVIRKLTF